MKRPNAKVATLAGAGLVGGIMAGAMLALAVPTGMTQAEGEGVGGGFTSAYESDYAANTIAIEAPPQDLAPQDWATQDWAAPQGYYAAADQGDAWVQPVGESDLDTSYADYADEPLPARMIEVGASSEERPALAHDDAAAASAEAARAAAADVRAVENAVVEAPGEGADTGTPQAASEVS